jgi:hypothetical protein
MKKQQMNFRRLTAPTIATTAGLLLAALLCGCSQQVYTADPSEKHEVQIKVLVSGSSATVLCETSDNALLKNAGAFVINSRTHQGVNSMLFGESKAAFKSLEKAEYDAYVSVMEMGGGQSGFRQISATVHFKIQ